MSTPRRSRPGSQIGARLDDLTNEVSTMYSPRVTGSDLRRLRKQLGLTQLALARLVGLHANSIARQERGEVGIKEPEARLVRLLAAQAEASKRRRRNG